MLCLEWGISWKAFQDTPFEVIGKIKEYRQAKSDGESSHANKQKTKATLDKILSKTRGK